MMRAPSAPAIPPLPPPPAPAPTPLDPQVQKARTDERKLAALAAGRQGTILTGGQGLEPLDNTTRKILLGQ